MLKAVAAMGSLLLPRFGRAQEPRKPTWMEIIGPFYPVEKPTDQDADLTQIEGRTERAQGDILYLSGQVLAHNGTPVAGAVLEVWQANAVGRYAHIGDKNPAPLDPNFTGAGRVITDVAVSDSLSPRLEYVPGSANGPSAGSPESILIFFAFANSAFANSSLVVTCAAFIALTT
jgi:hypothetical protein